MWFGIVTLFPEMFAAQRLGGVFARALNEGIVHCETFNPRDFSFDKHRTVDDKPYGGGAGMVMKTQPLEGALMHARERAGQFSTEPTKVILMSPQGRVFNQSVATGQSQTQGLILICGRYEGIDERFVQSYVDEEWSIGDFVLSGGEIPAMLVMDAIARHIPGVLGNSLSIIDESHLDGKLDYPHYTRPDVTLGKSVPQALLSGNHALVAEYRRREALKRTFDRRPDMLVSRMLSKTDRKLLKECFENEASNAQK